MNYLDFTPYGDEALEILNSDFESTSSGNLVYGETVMAFRGTLRRYESDESKKLYTHLAVYAGTNKEGEIFIHTKDGDRITPRIVSLSEFFENIPGGADNYEIHYYKPKNSQ